MLTKLNGCESKFQTKYFIKKESVTALRNHMKKMDEFKSIEKFLIAELCFTVHCF